MNEKVERIRSGTRPTEILREIRAENPELSGKQIGQKFIEDLPHISYGVVFTVGDWKEFDEDGCEDELVDTFIIDMMKRADLLGKDSPTKAS